LRIFDVKLKDGRIIQLRLFKPEDKDKLVAFYEPLSNDALRWGMPPYTREKLKEG